jgi:hypothetical protein
MPGILPLPRATQTTRSGKPANFLSRPSLERLEDRLVPSSTPTVDLTMSGAQGSIGGVTYQQGDVQPAGSGVIDAFLRIHGLGGAGQEQGYNTDSRPLQFDENQSPTFTRSIQLGDVPVVTINGVNYRAFILDINQKSSQPLLSLDQLQIFVANGGNLTGYDTAARQFPGATLLYDMNPGGGNTNWVKLNAGLSSGIGSSDMVLLVPQSVFASTPGNPNVYLFSRFGDNFGANGGFEQWAVRTNAALSTISGFVNNQVNGVTTPAGGIMLELTGVDANNNAVTLFAMTSGNGFYSFAGLMAGNYAVTEVSVPPFATRVAASVGTTNGTTPNGTAVGTGLFFTEIAQIALAMGVNGINYDFLNIASGS